MASSTLALVAMLLLGLLLEAQSVGVCYGRNGDNLPSDREVVDLYKCNNIRRMRIYDPNPPTLEALRCSGIELIVGVPNEMIQSLTDPTTASCWVKTNILHYLPDVSFRYIAVGNEIRPGDAAAGAVLPAMKRVREALAAAGQQDKIKVTTAVDTTLIAKNVSKPSQGVFAYPDYVNPIVDFLEATGAPILVNVYLYFAHAQRPKDVPLDYALFKSSVVRIQDGPYGYDNLFDAIMDTQYAALERAVGYVKNVGKSEENVVVSESGWPSKDIGKKHPNQGGLPSESDNSAATPENAETYYKNLMAHVSKGTPRRPGQAIETYLFAMFDENLKTPEIEQNYGLFYPNKTPKYQLNFN